MARSIKRDTRGRFSRVAGTKVGSAGRKKTTLSQNHKAARTAVAQHKRSVRPRLTTAEAQARHKKIVRNVNIARAAVLVGAATYAVYDINSQNDTGPRARRAHANAMGQRISKANTRGLGAMMIAKQSRRGVYKVTSL